MAWRERAILQSLLPAKRGASRSWATCQLQAKTKLRQIRRSKVEYIIAKSITRTGAVSLAAWNKNWHDHEQEIATGRVQVHDLAADKAKEVADLVATPDGNIFHLWAHDDKDPNGRVMNAQSVGHGKLTQSALEKGAS